MTLLVYSARITSADSDRLDVTRKAAEAHPDSLGAVFAPSWTILRPMVHAAREHARLRQLARETNVPLSVLSECESTAHDILSRAWSLYTDNYLYEMRVSWVAQRERWEELLVRKRVVLVCYCVDVHRCHRSILRTQILPKLGAIDCGEIRDLDAKKLHELLGVGNINDAERQSFQDMLDRLGHNGLTDKQRAWVDSCMDKLGLSAEEASLRNINVPRGREVETPAVLKNLPKSPPWRNK